MDNSSQSVFVVFNPKAGKEGRGDEIRSALASHFTSRSIRKLIYEEIQP
jgi:hypothetical protein